ncbi:hypothetical protein [Mycolicibacterium goodii]|uniref:Uncharacterized protein n=1 Tax=Mycolicibacterium goodii TaxID=134601 RepID=A0ABS6HS51_MYCGD|nr:hypothetical protein [Mycolicibacterium goodii]YP_009013565.1 hypothetical protein DORI_15 [Mycobacterium phage Dori]UVT31448.1 membrane protein [Mycobacterium phage Sejanus]UVT31548.1 membrane protein [Mycobacterium phage Mask]AER47666.1 hypothetical protein DORI_15 [Mycobacterium phage Dori]MBU8824122.1 hypothetical protein [Mycolicibacterium goodii]MBU8838095.1 hypothetical protein [Mycolicibacterium goodii]
MTLLRLLLSHTRIVQSGSPPLYRMLLVGNVISAILMIVDGQIPESVANNAPGWFDAAFIGGQLFAGILALTALYMEDGSTRHATRLHRSLSLEWAGLMFMQTINGVYFVAVTFNNSGPPTSGATWYVIMFWLWVWVRMRDIRRALKELEG